MRSLFLTAHLLQKEGIGAQAEIAAGRVRVSIPVPGNAPPHAAEFPVDDLEPASNWLVREVKRLYPTCALARVWAISEDASKV